MKKVLGFIFALVAAFVLVVPSAKAAGAITAQEQQILDALKQPVTVSGKKFYLPAQYLTQAENQLKAKDYSAAQVATAVAQINATIDTVQKANVDVTNINSFEDLVKALPADVKAAIKANEIGRASCRERV